MDDPTVELILYVICFLAGFGLRELLQYVQDTFRKGDERNSDSIA